MTTLNETQRFDNLLTIRQVAAMFGRAPTTIQLWKRERGLPFVRIPGDERDSIRFDVREIKKWARKEGLAYTEPPERGAA